MFGVFVQMRFAEGGSGDESKSFKAFVALYYLCIPNLRHIIRTIHRFADGSYVLLGLQTPK